MVLYLDSHQSLLVCEEARDRRESEEKRREKDEMEVSHKNYYWGKLHVANREGEERPSINNNGA